MPLTRKVSCLGLSGRIARVLWTRIQRKNHHRDWLTSVSAFFAYPTRVYLTGGTTLATYEYDMNTGRKITATDPKGNIFRYIYDPIGRLTSEKLDNPDPNVGVERDLIYNDQTNVVKLTFGNGTVQQEGRITFDALFGKPVKIQRKLNGAWTISNNSPMTPAGGSIPKPTAWAIPAPTTMIPWIAKS